MEISFQANLRFINLGDTFQKALSVGASVRKAGETPILKPVIHLTGRM